jgi:aryl-alcohol dehydrogenase-like predicted oxidoreductase
MFAGHATESATAEYAIRHGSAGKTGFFRRAGLLTVSSLGMGTYLGRRDPEADAAYTDAVSAAVRGGINFLDTSLNYRHQRSERNIGTALAQLIADGAVTREELIVCTKAGFLVPSAVPEVDDADVVNGMHCMTPSFLRDQCERSRANLGLETLDVLYLHNPETQLSAVDTEEFYRRVEKAFEALEEMVGEGKIAHYGAATWDGLRKPGPMSLVRMARLAETIGGPGHHFRFIQLPVNVRMPEAFTIRRETLDGEEVSTTTAAERLGITVVGSASLLQAKLAGDLAGALRFARSAPGVTVSLVGMGRRQHVEENLAVIQ